MSRITAAHLAGVLARVPGATGGQCMTLDQLAAGANAALSQAPRGLTKAGAAAFLATMAQESASFRTTEEYAKTGRYAPYIGRTFQQITWRANYADFGAWAHARGLVSDPAVFVNNPRALAAPAYAWAGGVWFFAAKGLWAPANAGQFQAVSAAVNGINPPAGWAARCQWYAAFQSLGANLLPLPPAVNPPTLRVGSSGPAVKALQTGLLRVFPAYSSVKAMRAHGGADGEFGAYTAAAVSEFQRRVGIGVDGVVGAVTRAKLAGFGVRF